MIDKNTRAMIDTFRSRHIPFSSENFKGVRATSFKTQSKVSENYRQRKKIMELIYMQIKRDIYLTFAILTFIAICRLIQMVKKVYF